MLPCCIESLPSSTAAPDGLATRATVDVAQGLLLANKMELSRTLIPKVARIIIGYDEGSSVVSRLLNGMK
jgi:hypothetical protein